MADWKGTMMADMTVGLWGTKSVAKMAAPMVALSADQLVMMLVERRELHLAVQWAVQTGDLLVGMTAGRWVCMSAGRLAVGLDRNLVEWSVVR
jgi:hypothetical protein